MFLRWYYGIRVIEQNHFRLRYVTSRQRLLAFWRIFCHVAHFVATCVENFAFNGHLRRKRLVYAIMIHVLWIILVSVSTEGQKFKKWFSTNIVNDFDNHLQYLYRVWFRIRVYLTIDNVKSTCMVHYGNTRWHVRLFYFVSCCKQSATQIYMKTWIRKRLL